LQKGECTAKKGWKKNGGGWKKGIERGWLGGKNRLGKAHSQEWLCHKGAVMQMPAS